MRRTTAVKESVDLLGLLRKRAGDADLDFLREAVAVLAEALMEAEVSAQIGAGYGERTPGRTTQRNGYRPRRWDTRVGTVELAIPKLRTGSNFPDAARGATAQRAGIARRRAAGLAGC
jgi:transposase-like protein